MSTEAPYFGIDFGTTNSSMAWCDPKTGRAEVILNEEGEEKTPSVVYFGEDEIIVGKYAEEKLKEIENSTDPEERDDVSQRVVRSIKRNLLDPPVIPLPGREPVRPVEVVAHILGKLKHDAEEEHFHEEVERVIVTCPATFDTQQQEVLLDGAAMAGFRRVELLEEPTAAAFTVTKQGQKIGRGLLIYDLGAGTFDLSVAVRDQHGSFYIPMEPQGDPYCGGDDLDLALYNHCEEIALNELGRRISLTEGVIDLAFLRQCRSRKENLSKAKTGKFSSYLSSDNGSQRFKHELDRETFEGLIRPRIEGTVKMTAKLWDQVKDQVDAVVLIGGSSRVPLVYDWLEEALQVKPQQFAGKDYAVALGAAYKAYELWPEGPDTVTDGPPEVGEYRRALESCWNNRWLNRHEVEWLAQLATRELELNPEVAARVERQVMDDTIEGVLGSQEPVARDRYATVLKLGWKDQKLDALRRIPSARLNMLLNDQDRFCGFSFADSPVSVEERKEMASGLPWWVFVMAARVVTAPELSTAAVVSGLDTIADELGLRKDQAVAVEREVLGSTIESALKRQEKVVSDRYRKVVEEASKKGDPARRARIKGLKASADELGLSKGQAEAIERKVMGNTASGILAEDKAVTELIKRHSLVRSRIKGSGKNGRITKRDVEAYIEERERKRKNLDLSKLSNRLDTHCDRFVAECAKRAQKIIDSDSNWHNNLGKCLDPALVEYARDVQKEAQAEVDKLNLGLTVPTFRKPTLSTEITAGKTYSDTGEVVGGVGGAAAGGVGGAVLGSAIFPVVGTAIGGLVGAFLGGAAGAGVGEDTTGTVDKEKSLTNVRTAAGELRPALKEVANNYLERVEKAVAAKLGLQTVGQDDIVQQLDRHFGV